MRIRTKKKLMLDIKNTKARQKTDYAMLKPVTSCHGKALLYAFMLLQRKNSIFFSSQIQLKQKKITCFLCHFVDHLTIQLFSHLSGVIVRILILNHIQTNQFTIQTRNNSYLWPKLLNGIDQNGSMLKNKTHQLKNNAVDIFTNDIQNIYIFLIFFSGFEPGKLWNCSLKKKRIILFGECSFSTNKFPFLNKNKRKRRSRQTSVKTGQNII